jgi:hypothetical protein
LKSISSNAGSESKDEKNKSDQTSFVKDLKQLRAPHRTVSESFQGKHTFNIIPNNIE